LTNKTNVKKKGKQWSVIFCVKIGRAEEQLQTKKTQVKIHSEQK